MAGLLLDQNMPFEVLAMARAAYRSESIVHVSETALKGADDQVVFDWAVANAFCIVTFDTDFADRRAFKITQSTGVVLICIAPANAEAFDALSRVVGSLEMDALFGALTIVDKNKIRHRRI